MAAIEKNMTYHYRSTPTSAIPTSTIHGALIIVCHNLELTYYVTGNILDGFVLESLFLTDFPWYQIIND